MSLFSDRYELSRASVIIDDAPRWFRSILLEQALDAFIANENAPRERVSMQQPVGALWLLRRIGQLTRRDPGTSQLNWVHVRGALRQMLMALQWYEFFDVIEIMAELTKKSDEVSQGRFDVFSSFKAEVNEVFSTSAIGWALDDSGKLERAVTEERAIAESQLAVLEAKDPARVHIGKARLMLNQRPCDAANAIKESVSAIESAGKAAWPGTNTLGDVLKELKTSGKIPLMFVVVLEKLYGFASSEPGVRHGSPQSERVSRAEAEFIYTMSLATITYLDALGGV